MKTLPCLLILGIILGAYSRSAVAVSAWVNSLEKAKLPYTRRYLKLGTFGKQGHYQEKLAPPQKCHPAVWGWIGHRLKNPSDSLSPQDGAELGKRLRKKWEGSCLQGVQIDLEPLSEFPLWLGLFLSEFKNEVKIPVSLAAPALTERSITGQAWRIADVRRALTYVDGVEFMMYDTHLHMKKEYRRLVFEALGYLVQLGREFPKHSLTLGLPAYKDRTKAHSRSAENLEVAYQGLEGYTSLAKTPRSTLKWLCTENFDMAIYANWTMDENDEAWAKKMDSWRRDLCRAPKP